MSTPTKPKCPKCGADAQPTWDPADFWRGSPDFAYRCPRCGFGFTPEPNMVPHQNWQRVVIEIGYALHVENAEQWESPEIAKAAILRQIKDRIKSQIDEIVTLKRAIRELHEIAEIAAETSTTKCQEALKQWEKHNLKLIEI